MSVIKDSSHFFRLIFVLGVKNLKLKYKNSFFGFLWGMFNPLIYLIIFSFVFGQMFSNIDRYPLYVLCGLLIWTIFTSTSIQIIESIVRNSGVIKSVSIPGLALPLGGLYTSVVSFILMLIPFSAMMLFFDLNISWEILLAIPLFAFFFIFTFGVSLILAALNVYFRDVQIAWSTFLPAVFYATPIAYSPEIIPEKYKLVLSFNPLYRYVMSFRELVFFNRVPDINEWVLIIAFAAISILAGLTVFNKLKGGFISQF
jgi:ABC-type polysaccharide/polyol phosphate export permease